VCMISGLPVQCAVKLTMIFTDGSRRAQPDILAVGCVLKNMKGSDGHKTVQVRLTVTLTCRGEWAEQPM
jgi:hypothetical protein